MGRRKEATDVKKGAAECIEGNRNPEIVLISRETRYLSTETYQRVSCAVWVPFSNKQYLSILSWSQATANHRRQVTLNSNLKILQKILLLGIMTHSQTPGVSSHLNFPYSAAGRVWIIQKRIAHTNDGTWPDEPFERQLVEYRFEDDARFTTKRYCSGTLLCLW